MKPEGAPGKTRRWMLRLVLGATTAVLVLTGALWLTVTSRRFEERVRGLLLERIERTLQAQAALETLEIEPWLLRARLLGLEVSAPARGLVVKAREVRVRLSRRALLGFEPRLESVALVGADIHLDLDRPAAAAPAGPLPAHLLPRRLELGDVSLHVLHPRQSLALADLAGTVTLGSRAAHADLRCQITELTWNGRALAPGRVHAVVEFPASGPLDLTLDGDLRSGTFDLAGTLTRDPLELDLAGRIAQDAATLSALAGKPGLARGSLEIEGTIRGPLLDPRFQGSVRSDEVVFRDTLALGALSADLTLSRRGAALVAGRARLLAGDLAFEGRAPFSRDDAAEATFRIAGLDVGAAAAAFPTLPLTRGSASAEGTARLPSGQGGEIEASCRFEGVEARHRPVGDPRLLHVLSPLDGTAQVSWRDRTWLIRDAMIRNRFFAGLGTLCSQADGEMEGSLDLSAADISPVATLATLATLDIETLPGQPPGSSFRLDGALSASLAVSGALDDPRVRMSGWTGPLTLVAAAPGEAERNQPLAAAEITGEYQRGTIVFEARSGPAPELLARGEVRFVADAPPDREVHVRATGLDAVSMGRLVRLPLPAEGEIELTADLRWAGERFRTRSRLRLDGSLLGHRVDPLDLAVATDAERVTIELLDARFAAAQACVSGTVERAGGGLDLQLEAASVDLGRLLPGLAAPPKGTIALRGSVGGTLARPVAAATVEIAGLTAWSLPWGDLAGTARLDGDRLDVHLLREETPLEIAATVRLEPPYATQATIAFHEQPFERLAELLERAPAGLGGEATGTAALEGRLTPGIAVDRVILRLDAARFSLGGVELSSLGPLDARLGADRRLRLADWSLLGEHGRLQVTGMVGLDGAGSEIGISGRTDLRLLRAALPDLTVSGPLDLDVRLSGTLERPSVEGTARLHGGYFRTPALPYPLRDVEARAELTGRQARLTDLAARFGGGQIRAEGDIDLAETLGPRLTLKVGGEDVRLTLLGGIEVRADPDLTYTLAPGTRRLQGSLHVTRAVFRPRPGESPALSGGAGDGLGGFAETRLDLDVVAESGLWLRADDIALEASARLRIGGTTSAPSVLGSIDYLSQEELTIQGRRYQVERGRLVFDDPAQIDPRLDFQAGAQIQDYRVILEVTGQVSNPKVTARSDPPLPEGDVLGLVAGVRPESEGSPAFGSEQLLKTLLLPRALGALGRRAPLRFTVDPLVLGGKADPTELVPLTIQVADDIDVTVGLPLREAQASLVILNWRPWRDYAISATRDLNRAFGLEVTHARRFGGPEAAGMSEHVVGAVRLEASGLDEQALAARLHVRRGQRLRREALRADAERMAHHLRRQGLPLARVTFAVSEPPGRETADIVFSVDPGAHVTIRLEGAGGSRLLDRLYETVGSFGLYGETVAEMERVARESLERQGYPTSIVDCESEPSGPGEAARYHCLVEPGEKRHVSRLTFRGNHHFDDQRLAEVMRTRPGWLRRPPVVTADLQADLEAISRLYREAGFRAVKTRAEMLPGREPDQVQLVVHIEEGQRFTARSVQVEGRPATPDAATPSHLGLVPGAALKAAALRADRDALHHAYDERGFLGAEVRATVEWDDEAAVGDVTYRVAAGEVVRVGEVRIEGTARTDPGLVRRELGIRPGEPLGYAAIARGQRRLYDLGIFRSVEIRPVPIAGETTRSDLLVRVVEAAPYRLQLGGGFDSQQGVRGLAELSDSNFTGRARLVALRLRGAADDRRIQLLLREPRPLGRRLPSLLTAFYERTGEVSFDRERLAFRLETTRVLGRDERTRALARYELSDTRLDRLAVSPLEAGAESVRLSSLGLSLVHDGRDDILSPSRGLLASADAEWAASGLGSQADYLKLTLKGYHYRRLARRLVWASAAQLGLGIARGGTERLPLVERYFAGGASTLRGLGFSQAGPRDPDTSKPTGGDAVLVLNQELRYDLPARLVGTLFVDAGDVSRAVADLDLADLRWSVGAGLRYRGPVVAGIDVAQLLDPRPGEKAYRIHFSLGYAF